MSSFLYRLGRFAAQRRAMVLAAWLVVLALAGVGALFNEGTDDSFEIPGTQSQDALDYLSRVFPQTSGSSAQLIVWLVVGALGTVLVTEQRRSLSSKQLRLGSVLSAAT